jgi:hypothetical protein
MFHCWGIMNGKPHAFQGDEVRIQNHTQLESWIPKSAVTFHRCKHPSLIKLLMERKYANRNRNIHTVISKGLSVASARDTIH